MAMDHILPFRSFDWEKETWDDYKKKLEQHFMVYSVEEGMKKTMFIDDCDSKTYTLLRGLCQPKTPVQKSYKELCDLLTQYFSISSNVDNEANQCSAGTIVTTRAIPQSTDPLPCSSGSATIRTNFPTPDEETEAKIHQFSRYINLQDDETDTVVIVQVFKDLDIEPKYYHAAISQLFLDNIDRDSRLRDLVALVISEMFEQKVITKADYLHALEEMFYMADDLIGDIPQLYENLASFYVTLLKQRYITLSNVRNAAQCVLQRSGATLLKELLLQYEALYGKDATIMLWYDSFLCLTDFIKIGSPETAAQYLTDANLGYLFEDLSMEAVCNHVQYLLKANVKFLQIYNWLSRYVSRQRKASNEFIRTITRAVIEHCIEDKATLNESEFIKWFPILQKYIDGRPERELNAMYAIQRLMVELEHPQNLMQIIMEGILYNDILKEGIALWLESTDPLEESGKRTCLEGITRFIEMFIYELIEDAEE
nr:eukaryotic translation initiation factor 4 gamma 3-like [Aedes albopictus]